MPRAFAMTRELAHAAAWDAGNGGSCLTRRPGGWTEGDYIHAVETFDRLWPYDEVHMPNGRIKLRPLGSVLRSIRRGRQLAQRTERRRGNAVLLRWHGLSRPGGRIRYRGIKRHLIDRGPAAFTPDSHSGGYPNSPVAA